jgi:hypothetical protein
MKAIRLTPVLIAASLMLLVCAGADPAGAREKEKTVGKVLLTELDFDACDPFETRGPVMEVDPAADTLVVAEREIRPMDVKAGERTIRTAYLDTEGKPLGHSIFHRGQLVRVKGWLHDEGFVAAASIQLLAKLPQEKPKLAPAKKPTTKRDRKLARRTARMLAERGPESAAY